VLACQGKSLGRKKEGGKSWVFSEALVEGTMCKETEHRDAPRYRVRKYRTARRAEKRKKSKLMLSGGRGYAVQRSENNKVSRQLGWNSEKPKGALGTPELQKKRPGTKCKPRKTGVKGGHKTLVFSDAEKKGETP